MSDNKLNDNVLDNDDLEEAYLDNDTNESIGGKSEEGSASNSHIIRYVLMAIFFLVFIISAISLIRIFTEYQDGVDIYESIQAAVFITDSTEMVPEGTTAAAVVYESISYAEIETETELETINMRQVREINDEGIAWIQIPAITRSYPVAHGKDNSYYLTHTFTGEENSAGCIFMDARNYSDFSDQNTIIYGHNMKNGTMFGMLNRFEKEDFYNENNHFFYITTDNGIRAYQIFACCYVPSNSIAYTIDFDRNESFSDFLKYIRDNSLYSTNVSVLPTDYVVTLSTCTSESKTRRIVVGKYLGTIMN